jgi:hypothetical protein
LAVLALEETVLDPPYTGFSILAMGLGSALVVLGSFWVSDLVIGFLGTTVGSDLVIAFGSTLGVTFRSALV